MWRPQRRDSHSSLGRNAARQPLRPAARTPRWARHRLRTHLLRRQVYPLLDLHPRRWRVAPHSCHGAAERRTVVRACSCWRHLHRLRPLSRQRPGAQCPHRHTRPQPTMGPLQLSLLHARRRAPRRLHCRQAEVHATAPRTCRSCFTHLQQPLTARPAPPQLSPHQRLSLPACQSLMVRRRAALCVCVWLRLIWCGLWGSGRGQHQQRA